MTCKINPVASALLSALCVMLAAQATADTLYQYEIMPQLSAAESPFLKRQTVGVVANFYEESLDFWGIPQTEAAFLSQTDSLQFRASQTRFRFNQETASAKFPTEDDLPPLYAISAHFHSVPFEWDYIVEVDLALADAEAIGEFKQASLGLGKYWGETRSVVVELGRHWIGLDDILPTQEGDLYGIAYKQVFQEILTYGAAIETRYQRLSNEDDKGQKLTLEGKLFLSSRTHFSLNLGYQTDFAAALMNKEIFSRWLTQPARLATYQDDIIRAELGARTHVASVWSVDLKVAQTDYRSSEEDPDTQVTLGLFSRF